MRDNGSDCRRRRSVRIPGYDYAAQGAYFLTLCTAGRAPLFGDVLEGDVQLSTIGEIVAEEWLTTAIRAEVELDAFVVMPNQVHAIVVLDGEPPGGAQAAPMAGVAGRRPRSLGSLVAGFKAVVTRRVNVLRAAPGGPVWQRNYFEHVIRSDRALERLRRYIAENPWRWAEDEENPDHR